MTQMREPDANLDQTPIAKGSSRTLCRERF